MSKRIREKKDDEEEGEKNKRLRALDDQRAADLMEVIEVGQMAGVPAIGLLAVLDTEGGPQETIVRMVLEEAHHLRLTSPRFAEIVDRVLGNFFVREVNNAIQRFRDWGGYTCNTIDNLLGALHPLLFTNQALGPFWFMTRFGHRLYTPGHENSGADMAVYDRLSPLSERRHTWAEFFGFSADALVDLRFTGTGHAAHGLENMEARVLSWVASSLPGGDHAYHAVLWCLVGGEFFEKKQKHSFANVVSKWPVEIMLEILLARTTYAAFPTFGVSRDYFWQPYWFARPRLHNQTFVHQHPGAGDAYSFRTYMYPTTRLYAAYLLAKLPTHPILRALAELPVQSPQEVSEARSVEETYLPFTTYTEAELIRVIRLLLQGEYRPMLEDVNGTLWLALRETLAHILTLPVEQGWSAEQMGMLFRSLAPDDIRRDDLLQHLPSQRPPDLLILRMFWLEANTNAYVNGLLQLSTTDVGSLVLAWQSPLYYADRYPNLVAFILLRINAMFDAQSADPIQTFRLEQDQVTRCMARLLQELEEMMDREVDAIFFDHGLSAAETARALMFIQRLWGVNISVHELARQRFIQLLVKGSRDSTAKVLRLLAEEPDVPRHFARELEDIFRREQEQRELAEGQEEEEDLGGGAAARFSGSLLRIAHSEGIVI